MLLTYAYRPWTLTVVGLTEEPTEVVLRLTGLAGFEISKICKVLDAVLTTYASRPCTYIEPGVVPVAIVLMLTGVDTLLISIICKVFTSHVHRPWVGAGTGVQATNATSR
jgi:hypothetical protein